jgi:hypothetical protein
MGRLNKIQLPNLDGRRKNDIDNSLNKLSVWEVKRYKSDFENGSITRAFWTLLLLTLAVFSVS